MRGFSCTGSTSLAFLLLTTAFCSSLVSQPCRAFEMFCGPDNCYDILGVDSDADLKDIKKKYRRLSLENHPDKNSSAEAAVLFHKVVRAHDVLTDAEMRAEYDDFLLHPEKYYWYYMDQMKKHYAPQANVKLVLLGLLTCFTVFHFANRWWYYHSIQARARAVPDYKKRVAMLLKTGAAANIEEAEGMVKLEVVGCKKPTWKDLLPVQMVCVPYYVAKWLYWAGHWVIAYKIKKLDYDQEDKEFLVYMKLNMTRDQWLRFPQEQRDEMVQRRIWEKKAYDDYVFEKRIELNKAGKGKKKIRYRRRTVDSDDGF